MYLCDCPTRALITSGGIPQIDRLPPSSTRSGAPLVISHSSPNLPFSFYSIQHPLQIDYCDNMPRQQINLEPYRDEIIALFQHGISSDSISRTLESRYNIQVKERTIQSRLRKWGIRKRSRTTTADETLHARIKVLFVQDRLTDKAMLKLLRQDGYDISERTLRRLRFQLGLHARASLEHERTSLHLPLPVSVPVTVITKGSVEA